MPTLEHDRLVFRFPAVEPDASVTIDFMRTLRIPDSQRVYDLPPGLGRFPLRHVEDYAARLPSHVVDRGGVLLPIWQAEALWLNFDTLLTSFGPSFEAAIKIGAGKINAVTGEDWRPGLHRDPQDYVVTPAQPWIDGFAVAPGVIRQFVAARLGEGASVEEQLTGKAEWGGLQLAVTPLKAKVWREKLRAWRAAHDRPDRFGIHDAAPMMSQEREMGLGAGGRMHQHIYPDRLNLEDYDTAATERVFVHLVDAVAWKRLTDEVPPTHPPRAKDYAAAGLPWFRWYGADQDPLPGGKRLAEVKSVGTLFKQQTGAALPDSEDIDTAPPVPLGPGASGPRRVKSGARW